MAWVLTLALAYQQHERRLEASNGVLLNLLRDQKLKD
jgi:hypothetical protein